MNRDTRTFFLGLVYLGIGLITGRINFNEVYSGNTEALAIIGLICSALVIIAGAVKIFKTTD